MEGGKWERELEVEGRAPRRAWLWGAGCCCPEACGCAGPVRASSAQLCTHMPWPHHPTPSLLQHSAPAPGVWCAEVNLVNLERVGFNLRNFDMIFIWKVGGVGWGWLAGWAGG